MKVIFSVLLMIFIIGCSKENKTYQYVITPEDIIDTSNVRDKEQFVERFSDYWEATSRNDFDKAYAYELPYLNFLKSVDWYYEFKKASKRKFTVRLLRITPEQDDADILNVRINFKSKQLDTNVTEKWIYINGHWYHSYSQSILPPKPPKVH